MQLPDLVYGNEILLSLLAAILVTIAILSRTFLSHKSTWVFWGRRFFWPLLDARYRNQGRPFLRCKDIDEYVLSVSDPLPEINKSFDQFGYDISIASTLKYRTLTDGTTQKSVASWVYRESLDAKWQQHAYVFPSIGVSGGYDIYHHKEISTTHDPVEHTDGERVQGDPDGILNQVFPYHSTVEIGEYINKCT